MTTKDIERKLKLLRELQRMAEEAQAEADAIKDEIKAVMGDSDELCAGEYKVTWKTVTTARIDAAALRKALPDLAEQFTVKSTVRRFCVI